MNANELIKNLEQLEKYRASLYLATDKMEHWYLQKVSQIVELGTDEVLSGKIEAGLLGFIKSEAGGTKSMKSTVVIEHPIAQGVVAEYAARASKTLVDLSSTEPKAGELLYYLGPARITIMSEATSPDNTELNERECAAIASVRRTQELILKAFDPNAGTIALTFRTSRRAFASIASTKSVIANALSSYISQKSFGILCTMENTRDEVVFLDPLWIWYATA
jgi:hypothetical protein